MNDNSTSPSQDNQIDLRRLWTLCRRHLRLFIWSMIITGVISFAVAEFVITPQYTAQTQILVNQKHNNSSDVYNNQQADIQMINTYKDIITNQVILSKASKQLDNPVKVVRPARKAVYRRGVLVWSARPAEVERTNAKSYHVTVKQLKQAISVQTQQNSQVFTLNVKTDNAAKSAAIANAVASSFKTQIKHIMSVNNVTIISRANTPNSPSFPNKKLFTLAGVLLGLVLSFIYVLIKDLTDTTIKSDEYMVDELGLTNLGTIGHINMSASEGGFTRHGNSERSRRRV